MDCLIFNPSVPFRVVCRLSGLAADNAALTPALSQREREIVQYDVVANATLVNGNLDAAQGWLSQGNVQFANGTAVLNEVSNSQTRLSQVFMVGAQDRYLSFTLGGTVLDDQLIGPDDAFEAALLDANTGASLAGALNLSRTDALFNLQANGTERVSQGITRIDNADGSRTYLVDLSGIAADTAVNLSFDLIGFGGNGSQVTINDVRLLSAIATNSAPLAVNDAVSTLEDQPLTFNMLANDQDAEGDTLTPIIVQAPSNGTLAPNADGSFTYTPNANFFGADAFTYIANDGEFDSNLATVSITINPVNDAPVAADVAASTVEDTGLTIDLVASAVDIDSATLSALIVTGPANGVLTQNADGTYTYTPNANFFGTDSFTYRVSDGEFDSSLATVSLTVAAANDAPLATDDVATTAEDTALVIDVRANDQDLDSTTLSTLLVAGPQHGALALNPDGSFTYTPNANFFGQDSFTYRLRDEELESNLATVNITVTPVNDAPTVADYTVLLDEDAPLILNPLAGATDVDGDLLQALPGIPAHGTLAQNADGTFIYTPDANFFGTDSLSFSVTDGSATVLATLTLNVQAVNDAPLAADIAASMLEDTTLDLDLRNHASDVDSTALTPSIVAGPTHGSLTTNADGSVSYTAAANFFGTDSFTYRVRDEELDSNVATVSITVASVNDAPQGLDATVATQEDVPYVFQVADFGFSDLNDAVANHFLAVTLDSVPVVGSLTPNGTTLAAGQSVAAAEIAAGLLVFAPAPNDNGTGYAAFRFRVQDDGGTENDGVDRDPQAKTRVNLFSSPRPLAGEGLGERERTGT